MKQSVFLDPNNLHKNVTLKQVEKALNLIGNNKVVNLTAIFNNKATMKLSDVLNKIQKSLFNS